MNDDDLCVCGHTLEDHYPVAGNDLHPARDECFAESPSAPGTYCFCWSFVPVEPPKVGDE